MAYSIYTSIGLSIFLFNNVGLGNANEPSEVTEKSNAENADIEQNMQVIESEGDELMPKVLEEAKKYVAVMLEKSRGERC